MSRRENIGNWPEPGIKISKGQLKELVEYGAKNNIDVLSFENYDGDTELIKEFIDSIVRVAEDYPEILYGKRNLQLRCSYQLNADDYAETTNNCININGNAFRSRKALEADYEEQQSGDQAFFVDGTTYRNIVHHEIGHIIVKKYGLSPKQICKGFKLGRLSEYGSTNVNEAIAESFSAYYAGVDNETALHIKQNCDRIIKKRRAEL